MSNRNNWRLGISIHFNEDFSEKIYTAKAAGFESVDFDLCLYWTNREKEIELYKGLESGLDAIRESGMYFNSVHISFGPNWDISRLDADYRHQVLCRIREIFKRCDKYKPYTYVIHGSYGPIDDEAREDRIKALVDSLREIRGYTDTNIALETLTAHGLGNTADEIISIVDSVPGIGICLDTNHFLKEKTEDAISKIGKRILTTHISDHDYIAEKHWLPGEGKINWKAVIEALEEVGYTGSWTYELGLKPTKTIDRPRDFSYADFIQNASELFSGKEITVIGKPKY